MKASELLRCYAAGERDFRRTNLRGQNFAGQNLSGADFSEADIRGTNFSKAMLKGANFTRSTAGVQKRWVLIQLILIVVMSTLGGFLQGYFASWITLYIPQWWDTQDGLAFAELDLPILIAFCITAIAMFVAIAQYGFTNRALVSIVIATVTASTIAFIGVDISVRTVMIGGAIVIAGTLAGAGAVATTIAVTGTMTGAGNVLIASVIAIAGTVAGIIAFFRDDTFVQAVAITVATTSFTLGIYCSYRASKNDVKFVLLCALGIGFSALGGTSFCGSNLTNSNFSKANLTGANFTNAQEKDCQGKRQERETVLEWVCWHNAQGLDRARVGKSTLSNPAVRELLVTRNGYKGSYVDANLRATNLDGVNLEKADLTWADLTCATLRHANLKDANLAESLVLHADFTGAYLTGACLEAWNIDSQTILDQVDCQYVYLLRNQQERRPSSSNFASGEFTKLFQEVLSTVDLIFRSGVDWRAFITAFQQVQVQNENTPLEVQSIENKGDGVVVVRVSTSPHANKEKIHSEFNQQYELALKALEAKYRAELQAKEGEIAIYREQSVNMWGVINSLANRPINVQAIAEAKAMNDSTDQSRNINIGGNVTGSTLNLGEISGTVTNTINQLPDSTDSTQPSLKELLTQLQQAIESESQLPDPDKTDLLEQVKVLAEVPQTQEPAQKEGMARRAKKLFEATLKSLPDTAKLAEACSKLLPLILKALGL